jgi:hypothetical protein
MIFDRSGKDAQKVLGVGHKLVDQAIAQARASSACVAALPGDLLPQALFVFRIIDRVTSVGGTVRAAVVGVEDRADGACQMLRDWELVLRLNALLEDRLVRRPKSAAAADDRAAVEARLAEATRVVEGGLANLDLPFKVPQTDLLAILWPTPAK